MKESSISEGRYRKGESRFGLSLADLFSFRAHGPLARWARPELLPGYKRRVQVTLSAPKIAARVGAKHEKDRHDGICLCIHRREDQRAWRLAREDARQGPRNHPQGRP